jgi:hypothetical protein
MRRPVLWFLVPVLALAGCWSDGSTPPQSSGSDASALEHVPWWSAGILHLPGGGEIATVSNYVDVGGDTTIVGPGPRRAGSWSIVRGDQLVPLVSATELWVRPVISANGRFVAWVTSATPGWRPYGPNAVMPATFRVTEYDVANARELGSTTLSNDVQGVNGAFEVTGVDADGAVVVTINDVADDPRSWIWRPGDAPVPIRTPPRAGLRDSSQWPDGITYGDRDGEGPAHFAKVDDEGGVHEVGQVPRQFGTWSPDGSSYAFNPYFPTHIPPARVWSEGRVIQLLAPKDASVWMWESPTVLLLTRASDAQRGSPVERRVTVVRCDVTTRACEQAGPTLHDVALARSGAWL